LNVSIVLDWERSLRAAPLRIQYLSIPASKKNAPAVLSQGGGGPEHAVRNGPAPGTRRIGKSMAEKLPSA
jgi:hypothetical protein